MIEAIIDKLDKQTTLNVNLKVTKQFYFRLWVAKKLIELAAHILNCGVQIETKNVDVDCRVRAK